MKIITEHLIPPIPTTSFDWLAYFDGEEDGQQGFGDTEATAISDLLENKP